ncbi:hypothetical protein ACIRL2_50105 [Embleya sp. NPDC127516]|uniref:hypothetical protein n=1 Tax=Embleya sp. NPDC127516 TaxID=3363990 RepID=UPI00381895B1
MSEELAGERASAAPMPGRVGGQALMLIPHRAPGVEEDTPEGDTVPVADPAAGGSR